MGTSPVSPFDASRVPQAHETTLPVSPFDAAAVPQVPQSSHGLGNATVFENPEATTAGLADTVSPVAASRGNLTLTVSEEARQEDKAFKDAKEKRKALEESRKEMLAKLTRQVQLCLTRLQDDSLDEQKRENYQEMLSSLKMQMNKLSGE